MQKNGNVKCPEHLYNTFGRLATLGPLVRILALPALLHNFPKLKANSGPKALKREFSRPNMRNKCRI